MVITPGHESTATLSLSSGVLTYPMREYRHPRFVLHLSVPLPRVPALLAPLPHPPAPAPQCCSMRRLPPAGTMRLPALPARPVLCPPVLSSADEPWHPRAGAVSPL